MLTTILANKDILIDLGANFVCKVNETLIASKNPYCRI